MKDPTLIYIEWEDTKAILSSWQPLEEIKEASTAFICKTLGFKILSDRKSITVCSNMIPDNDNLSGCIIIPRSAILSTLEVKLKDLTE